MGRRYSFSIPCQAFTTARPSASGAGLADRTLSPVLDSCLRRICAWRVPPNWSAFDWFEEMQAQAACAVCQAVRDYDPARGVPFSAFARQRLLTSALTRYRQEWAYAVRWVVGADGDENESSGSDSFDLALVHERLRQALARLSEPERWLLKQLFWKARTEADIAHEVGITQQAVSKRKHLILRDLLQWMCHTEPCLRPKALVRFSPPQKPFESTLPRRDGSDMPVNKNEPGRL